MPVVVAMDIYQESFYNCGKRGGKVTTVTGAGDTCLGNHAMCIEGWNEYGWIVANSWGDKWGDGTGDCFVPYNYDSYMEFWTIVDYVEPIVPPIEPPIPPIPPEPPKPPELLPFTGFTWKYDAKKKKLTIKITDKNNYDYTIKPNGMKTKSKGFVLSKVNSPFIATIMAKDGRKGIIKG